MEPDHSSLVRYMLEKYPEMMIVANARTLPMLTGYYGITADKVLVMKEGESLSLGSCSLSFHMIPMVHWPETMVTWMAEENTVFAGDAFGTFGALDADVVDSEDTFEKYRDEMMRYYSNIVGKYGIPVQSALKKLSGLEVRRICSTHGPVWEKCIPEVVALYDKMSRYEVERGVCIVYGSMYGNTGAAAKALACELESRGIEYSIRDLSRENLSYAYMDLFKYEVLAVGSPTYNNGIYPPVAQFLSGMQARLVSGRKFFAFGSYSWSAQSVKQMNEVARKMNYELISDGISFAQGFSAAKCDMSTVADAIAESLK
jgi:flavorubredoxin